MRDANIVFYNVTQKEVQVPYSCTGTLASLAGKSRALAFFADSKFFFDLEVKSGSKGCRAQAARGDRVRPLQVCRQAFLQPVLD